MARMGRILLDVHEWDGDGSGSEESDEERKWSKKKKLKPKKKLRKLSAGSDDERRYRQLCELVDDDGHLASFLC